MPKRGRANGNYGRWRRAITDTFNGIMDAANETEEQERRRFASAVTALGVFLASAEGVDKPGAVAALETLRELVESVEIEVG